MNWLFGSAKRSMITPGDALPGRPSPGYGTSEMHTVLGTSLSGPWPDNPEVIYLGMGCFWGAEKKFWRLSGVVGTSVGYMGGFTPHPTYEEVCTGRTGHTETVMVAYDLNLLSTYDVLKVFWENHDPTQGFAQGNDVGTQYRSALYWTTEQQHEVADATRDAYNDALAARGFDPITTEIAPAADRPYYLAEDYHQQYLFKNPNGYDCHAHTGIDLPPDSLGT